MKDVRPSVVRPLSFLTAMLLGTLLPVSGPAGAAPSGGRTFGPHEAVSANRVTEVSISPDGERIAYVLEVPRRPFVDDDGRAYQRLHLVGAERTSRVWVGGAIEVSDVAWRPAHHEISFLAEREGDDEDALYAIAADGGEARRLLTAPEGIREYAWSPDGRSVAYLARRPKEDGLAELEEAGFSQTVFEELDRPIELWIATQEEGRETFAEPRRVEIEGSASMIRWSPAGDRLALAVAPTSKVDDELVNRRFVVLDAVSGEVTGRVDHRSKLEEIRFSPDGSTLALIVGEDRHDPSAGRLMVASAAGGAPRDLMPELLGQIEFVDWIDARSLLYVMSAGVETSVGTIDLGGGRRELVAPGTAVWSGLSLSSGAGALIGQSPSHPDEVFSFDPASGEVDRLTDSNPWLAEVTLAPQEVVRYPARDGLELEGVLIRPLAVEAGSRAPLILVIHGGPEAHYRNGWLTSYSMPGQLAAARGFAVFYPNYRGSTGRGVEFSKLSQGDPAGKEFDDYVDAIDHLASTVPIDRDRVGITGGSYGGYASAWAATYYTERFAAAVMSVGISDKISKWGTSDIPEELYLVHDRHYPWDDWRLMLERSPIYYSEQARTPILILHGDSDTRVHPGQSLELFRYLKTIGKVPVRLVLFKDEGHGNRRAGSRLDFNLRMMRWFEHYLQGEGGEPPPPAVDYPRPEGTPQDEEGE